MKCSGKCQEKTSKALAAHREVFPHQIEGGYVFNSFTEVSAKL
jgi:hypothetical protein